MVDQYGYSASFWAAIRLDPHCLEVLLEHGAIDGESLITLAFLYTANHHRQNARLECMRTLIKYGKLRLGAKYLRWAAIALHLACRNFHYGCLPPEVPLLLEAGANLHTCDRYGLSPLYYAVFWNNHLVIKALLDAGLSTQTLTRQNFWTVLTNAHEGADGITLRLFIPAKFKVTDLSPEDWLQLEIPLADSRKNSSRHYDYYTETRKNYLQSWWEEFIIGLQERVGYLSSTRLEQDVGWAGKSENHSHATITSEGSRIKEISEQNHSLETGDISNGKGAKSHELSDLGNESDGDNNSDEDFEDAVEFHEGCAGL
ncbi:hypothetical protein OCU04_004496 [Sclerotinia nivalis]|uniref:Ankyrin repeat protein n=1 Tax=Sclerotinia nivalis TaxID=352851 RepID=A0A9X0AQL0_9HELO|nr:hypothetical protein OCU04_004496 [Sclerotinia nivalis]